MNKLYRTNCWTYISNEFIDKTFSDFHYSDDQKELFTQIAWSVRNSIKDQECAELLFEDDYIDIAFTLGSRLDLLVLQYKKSQRLLEALMATNISSALLMEGYRQFEIIGQEFFERQYVKVQFWGSEVLPMETLPQELSRFKYINIKCTEGMNLQPSQTVVYRMLPACTRSSLCDECNLGKNGRCMNN